MTTTPRRVHAPVGAFARPPEQKAQRKTFRANPAGLA
jgi:hypothetical protein